MWINFSRIRCDSVEMYATECNCIQPLTCLGTDPIL
jgi:hypothetical protein